MGLQHIVHALAKLAGDMRVRLERKLFVVLTEVVAVQQQRVVPSHGAQLHQAHVVRDRRASSAGTSATLRV